MGDTDSIGVLLPPLERICAEHRAMVLLLKESGGSYWRADVTHREQKACGLNVVPMEHWSTNAIETKGADRRQN